MPWDVARTSPNRRLHPAEARAETRAARGVALLFYRQAGSPVMEAPVEVRYVVRRARPMDDDNVIAALKPIRDALFNRNLNGEGITFSDTPSHLVNGPVTFDIRPEYRHREEVVVIVRSRTGG